MALSTTGPAEDVRLLYVDSDEASRTVVASALRADGRFTVETAADVAKAWEQLDATAVDCVVAEHDLGAQTGLEFLDRFRERYPDRPFVIYTASGSESIASDAIAAGVTGYCQRDPSTEDHTELADRIASLVEDHRADLAASIQVRAMEEAPIGITIADATRPDEPLVYVNQQFQELTGYDESEVLGRNCRFLQGQATAPEPVARLREAIDRKEAASVELQNYRQDGSSFWNRVTIAPLTDEEGHCQRFVGFQEDVTEARERDRRQKAVVRVLRELYDVTTDMDRSLEEKIDRALELGTEVLELPYGFLTEIETPEEQPPEGVQKLVQSVGTHPLLQPGESCPLSKAYCRKTLETDGLLALQDAVDAGWEGDPAYETFELGSYIGGKVVVDGELYGTLCFAGEDARSTPFSSLDRTLVRLISKWVSYELEHREATRELERQNERLEEFASVVSHDVQNPLNVAQGRIQMAQEECESPHLHDAASALDRIEVLVTDLLELARRGDSEADLAPVDLATIVEDCWSHVETSAATLENTAAHTIQAEENRLKQVIENLIDNAITHNEGPITVTIGDLEDGFYVEDDGRGIPPEDCEAVMEAGYSDSADGTGFGLSIVEQVAATHDWTVTLEERDGGGARFEFTGVTIVE